MVVVVVAVVVEIVVSGFVVVVVVLVVVLVDVVDVVVLVVDELQDANNIVTSSNKLEPNHINLFFNFSSPYVYDEHIALWQ